MNYERRAGGVDVLRVALLQAEKKSNTEIPTKHIDLTK